MIKLISDGHLTATDKKHIEALFKAGYTRCKINRTFWEITQGNPSENKYTLRKIVNDRGLGLIGEPLRHSQYTYTIIYT